MRGPAGAEGDRVNHRIQRSAKLPVAPSDRPRDLAVEEVAEHGEQQQRSAELELTVDGDSHGEERREQQAAPLLRAAYRSCRRASATGAEQTAQVVG